MPLSRTITRENARRGNRLKSDRLKNFALSAAAASSLAELANGDRPADNSSCTWPDDVSALAAKIDVEKYVEVRRPVTDRDRRMLLSRLPACIEVQRNDPRFA